MATITTEVIYGLGDREPTLPLAIDIEGAVTAVLPGVLIEYLTERGFPAIILNFVAFITTQKEIFFPPVAMN